MPPVPADFKNLIPGSTSALCEKLNKLVVDLSQKVYEWISFEYAQDGQSLNQEFVDLLCAAQCQGGGGGGTNPDNPNMPVPGSVSATDGTFSDKVVVSWDAVVPPAGVVTNYLVYRSRSTNSDPKNATLLSPLVPGTEHQFDDMGVIAPDKYNYWVRATNGIDTSAYAGPDIGNAGSAEETFPGTTNLAASQGFSDSTTGLIALVFTPPIGTASIDVYRHTANDSATAVKVHSDVVCNDTLSGAPTPASGVGINNLSGYVIYDQPPDGATKYFYWIKCKAVAPPRISPFSNAAQGWVQIGTGDAGVVGRRKTAVAPDAFIVPPGVSKMRVVLRGGGGAGGGASPFFGAGGGSGGATLLGVVDVAPGQVWNYRQVFFHNPSSAFGNPPHSSPLSGISSYEGKGSRLDCSSPPASLQAAGGYNGLYSTSGAVNGAPAASIVDSGIGGVSIWEEAVYPGGAGENSSGTRGGRGGESFGWYSTPPAHFLGGSSNGNGTEGSGGGGSTIASAFDGGANGVGWAVVCFFP